MKTELLALHEYLLARGGWHHRLLGNGSIISHRHLSAFANLW